MKNFKQYNESLTDQMTPKNLSDDDKYVYEQYDKLKIVDNKLTPLKKVNNVYYTLSHYFSLLVTYCDPKTYKGDEEIGYQQDHIVKIKKGWTLYTRINNKNRDYNNKDYIINTDNFDVIHKKIIEECHKGIESHIDDVKQEIKEKEALLNRLEDIKKLKETL